MHVKYRIYIDEVGNADLKSSDNPNHRFLSLTGVVIDLKYAGEVLYPQLENLKAKYFLSHPDEPVIFHRKEMVNCKGPFRCLFDKNLRNDFDEELLEFLKVWDYTVISVCLDKKKHKDTYETWRYHPYHYCLAMLLERYSLCLNRREAQGDAMAESRGGKEDRKLKDSFSGLWQEGTGFITPEDFQKSFTSKQLKVKNKANNVAGLQLADLIAYPSRNEILHEQNLLERELAPFAKKVVEILQDKYDQSNGRVYGKKFL